MKPISPSEARLLYRPSLRDDYIIKAYNELIHGNMDIPLVNEATFSQAELISKMFEIGCHIPHSHAIAMRYLNMEKEFTEVGWIVKAQPGFYDTVNGHLIITFKLPDEEI